MNSETLPSPIKNPLVLIGGGVVILLVLGLFFFKNTQQKSSPDLKITSAEKDSTVMVTDTTSYFALEAYSNPLYTAQKEHLSAVEEFINSAPHYASTEFIPKDFLKNATLERNVLDKDDPFLVTNGANLSNEHYFYNQTIGGIPVFNAQLIVHLRNNNEIYSVHGNLLKNTTYEKEKINEDQAREIALQKAHSDATLPQENDWDPDAPAIPSQDRPLMVDTTKKYILNKKIIGVSDNETTYLTLAVLIRNADVTMDDFSKEYFVDLATGTIVYEQDLIHEALSRQVNCTVGAGCSAGRNEGQPPTSSAAINSIYDMVGTYYNFMFQNFQRDSLDGNGGAIIGYLRPPCRNASWNGRFISICNDMVVPDVVYHELTHGVVTNSVRLGRTIQSGALNEGNSDVFAVGMQQDDYIMKRGDGQVIRDLQNPISRSQPDTLFSPSFRCPGEVHHESTVMGHAFYLMAEGGNKNNCAISPIGKLNALKIQYLGLTRYYSATANYRTHYTALMNACNDLFQQGSSTCRQVEAALVATQIDQQTANTQTAPKCAGIAAKPIVCPAPVATAPTAAPTAIQPTSAAQPTTAPLPTTSQPTQASVPTTTVEQPTVGVPAPTFTCLGSCPTLTPSALEPTTHTTPPPVVNQPTTPPQQPQPGTGSGGQGSFLDLILQLIRLLFGFSF